jgi:hypothetical protein
VRDNSVLRSLLGLCVSTVVVVGRELEKGVEGRRSKLVVWVQTGDAEPGSVGAADDVGWWHRG